MAIIALSEYKTYRGIADSTKDARLQMVIDAINAEVVRYCGRDFESAQRTETYDGLGSPYIVLRNSPVSSVASVTITLSEGSTITVDSAEYHVEASTGILHRGPRTRRQTWLGPFADEFGWPSPRYLAVWPEGFQNVTVTYTGGYSPVPADLKLACFQLVDAVWLPLSSGADPSVQSESLGDYSVAYKSAADVVARNQSILRRWSRGSAL